MARLCLESFCWSCCLDARPAVLHKGALENSCGKRPIGDDTIGMASEASASSRHGPAAETGSPSAVPVSSQGAKRASSAVQTALWSFRISFGRSSSSSMPTSEALSIDLTVFLLLLHAPPSSSQPRRQAAQLMRFPSHCTPQSRNSRGAWSCYHGGAMGVA